MIISILIIIIIITIPPPPPPQPLPVVNGTVKAREAGRSFGLKLTLDAKQDDYLRSMDHYYGAGFRVSRSSVCYTLW